MNAIITAERVVPRQLKRNVAVPLGPPRVIADTCY